MRRALLAVAVAVALLHLLPAAPAAASPWTLPRGEIGFFGSYNYQVATTEFLDSGGERAYPLRGQYSGSTYTLGVRAGFTDRLEFEVQVPIRFVSFEADTVILAPCPTDPTTMEDCDPDEEVAHYRRNVLDFNGATAGLGDLILAGRYRWFLEPFAMASELRIKTPTGYDGPEGTFGEEPRTRQEFIDALGRGERVAAPENISDDVTLGDGQLDLTLSQLFGIALPTRTFIRIDMGYALRTGGAADQITGAFRMGQLIFDRFIVYAGVRVDYSVQEGRSIGVSVDAVDPDVRAVDYSAADLNPRTVRLYRDIVDVGGGIIYKITDSVELNLGVSRIVWGHNVAAVNSLSFGIAVRTQAPGMDEEEELVEEEPEPEPEPVAEPPVEPAPEPGLEPAPGQQPLDQPDA